MKKILLLGALVLCSKPIFAQGVGVRVPVFAVSFVTSAFSYNYQKKYHSFIGIGGQIEFMVGGRLYFYGLLGGDYYFNIGSTDSNSLQFGFGMGLGYIIKNNYDTRGFSFAINIAPLGIGLDIRDVGSRQQNSAAFYRFQVSFPLRFHYLDARTVQLSPYLMLGAHTRGAVYNFMVSGGISLGLTF